MARNHPRGHVLQAYFDAELPREEAAAVEEHLRACAQCREVLAELDAVQRRMAGDPLDVVPHPVWPRIAGRLPTRRSMRLGPAFAFGTVAAGAAGVILGLLLGAAPVRKGAADERIDWTSAEYLWSGGGGGSLLDVFSRSVGGERPGE